MLLAFIEKMMDSFFALIPRAKPHLEQTLPVRLIAHRGAHNNAQGIIENTMPAFQLAEKAGCWGIELDVHASSDQILVVHHDHTLKRLWGHNQAIADLSFAQLRVLTPEIPTLAEVIAEFGQRMHLFIELKSPFQSEAALVTTLNGLSADKDYHLLTLDASIFASLSQFPSQSLLLVAAHNNVSKLRHLSLKENYGGLLGHYLLLTNKSVQQLKAAKQEIGVGFVDSKYSLYRELNRGINWIFTNNAIEMAPYVKSL